MRSSVPSLESLRLSGSIPVPQTSDVWVGTAGSKSRLGALRRRLARGLGLQLLLGLLLCGPVLAWLVYGAASRHQRFATEMAFGDVLADRAHELDRELNSFSEVLQSLRGLFDASNAVDRSEFAIFTRGARARHPEIVTIGFAPRVTDAARASHEADAANDGLARYRVTSRDPDGSAHAAPPSADHYPIFYVEPMSEGAPLLGFDLASEELRRRAIVRTTQTGQPTATDPVELWTRPDGGPGALLVLGVYEHRSHADHGSAPSHAGDVPIGVVFLSFQFVGVVRGVQASAYGVSWSWLDLVWTDESANRPRRVFPHATGAATGVEAPFASEQRIAFAGENYALRATPTALFLDQHRDVESLLFATLVFVGWELLALGLYVIARSWRTSALRRQSRSIGLLLRSLAEGVIMADRDGSIRVANDAALRMLGVTIGDLQSPDWPSKCGFVRGDWRTPYDPDRVPLARAAKGDVVAEEELLIRRPDESRGLCLWASARPLVDEGNVLQGGVMVLRDMTDQRRSEESSKQLSSAVEQTADAVYITDQRGLVRYVNPGFRTTTGFSDAEVLGRSPDTLEVGSRDDDISPLARWASVLAGEAFRGTIIHRRKDCSFFEVEQTITPMKDPSGRVTHAVVVMRDMTERRRLEETEVEMRLASEVQQRLYPRVAPSWEGLDVAGAALSAVATCGDYFDYARFADGTFLLVIGDVSGHGLGPALVMAETRAYLRSLVDAGVEISEILRRINGRLRADLSEGTFVTLLLVGVDPRTRRISHASAGHTPALLVDAKGTEKARLMPTGPALGIFDRPMYAARPGPTMGAGDVLVLMTDGVSESSGQDGVLFDEAGVVDVVRRCSGENAATILGTLQGAIDVFSGGRPRRDDITLVVCKSTG